MHLKIRSLLLVLFLIVTGSSLFSVFPARSFRKDKDFFLKEERDDCFEVDRVSRCMTLLGGLRVPLAIWLWMKVATCWENQEWIKMHHLMELILELQPYEVTYYTMAAWQLAWNASSASSDPSTALYYIHQGRRLLEQGIIRNPESSLLYENLGVLLRDRLHDHEGAAAAFRKAVILPGGHSYLRRFVVYELAALENHETEALIELKKLENDSAQCVPALLTLEEKLERQCKKN
jgi:hypothetical protein